LLTSQASSIYAISLAVVAVPSDLWVTMSFNFVLVYSVLLANSAAVLLGNRFCPHKA